MSQYSLAHHNAIGESLISSLAERTAAAYFDSVAEPEPSPQPFNSADGIPGLCPLCRWDQKLGRIVMCGEHYRPTLLNGLKAELGSPEPRLSGEELDRWEYMASVGRQPELGGFNFPYVIRELVAEARRMHAENDRLWAALGGASPAERTESARWR